MALSDRRFLSERHTVRFLGFESNTFRLQQEGWALAAEQDFERGTINLALHHQGAGLYMLGREQGFNYHRAVGLALHRDQHALVFDIVRCSTKISITEVSYRPPMWEAIDATPCFVDTPIRSMSDMGIFNKPMVRTEEILIEPSSVAECLDLIRRLQVPDLAEIRKRNARRDSAEIARRETFHAQILSLAA